MSTFKTRDGTEIYFKDWGEGRPVVFSHGWALNADAWDEQLFLFASNGYRAIAHDRRGHGRSSQASVLHEGRQRLRLVLDGGNDRHRLVEDANIAYPVHKARLLSHIMRRKDMRGSYG